MQPKSSTNKNKDSLLNCLAELFYLIVTMKKKQGIVQPKKFIARLRKDNDAFDNLFQQDAHEFLNYLLNTCADILKAEMKEPTCKDNLDTNIYFSRKHINGTALPSSNNNFYTLPIVHTTTDNSTIHANATNSLTHTKIKHLSSDSVGDNVKPSATSKTNKKRNSFRSVSSNDTNMGSANSINTNTTNGSTMKTSVSLDDTWIHELFQGTLVNETKCLNCETVSSILFAMHRDQ
jgi:ubiquitin C-terminal hydrolase